MTLIEKIRKARQRQVDAGGFTFTVSRPTDIEAAKLGKAGTSELLEYVTGWSGVQELHLIPGGSPSDVTWDKEVCREFLADRPDLWGPLVEAVLETYSQHVKTLEEDAKN
jgi:hypothetical protein